MLTSAQIRTQFLDFFKSKKHEIVRSAPVVPLDDPTLMFTNAGMNQFKDVFLGQGTRTYLRASDTQKCIRVSGKHNDLEEVGRDGYHHTFFEMLGNWSFGDYYKKEACEWAWELLTGVWKLDPKRLYITVFRTDDEAVDIWNSIDGVDETHVLRFDEKDNFWEMGEVGPCGPCSEIHYDRTEDFSGAKLVNLGHEDVIEIWNLVFIQYNRKKNGKLEELSAKHIDTGMGFERIVSILQNKKSNYSTDVFEPILSKVAELSSIAYTLGKVGIPHQVIADHIRMITFSIADGALPSNEGRGYVVRRILRRAARFGRKLGLNKPFMYKLTNVMVDIYGDIFPEILEQSSFITQVIKAEEVSFKKNLDRGMKLFDNLIEKLNTNDIISGHDVFILYDTYGFPSDMTSQMAEEAGFKIDLHAYTQELAKAKERSKENSTKTLGDWITLNNCENSIFTGYDETQTKVQISKFRKTYEKDSEGRELIEFILTKTPFYGESGGQAGDNGIIEGDSFIIKVLNTHKIQGQHVSIGTCISGEITADFAIAKVNLEKRNATKRNHTATHLLQQSLRDVLGDHVKQKGSLNNQDYLRFDFSHFEAPTSKQLDEIELIVNKKIIENIKLSTELKNLEDAKATGATALFGEKYDDVVRVVSIGDYSIELCGGTHATSSGDIGLFKIISESSISAGVRRIEAVTGLKAYYLAVKNTKLISDISAQLKCASSELTQRINSNLEKMKTLQKENDDLSQKILLSSLDKFIDSALEHKDIKIISQLVEISDVDAIKKLGHALRDKLTNAVVILGTQINAKAIIIVAIGDALASKGLKAGAIINPIAKIVGGGGGGHPKFAQAGGKNPAKLSEAIANAPDIVKNLLS